MTSVSINMIVEKSPRNVDSLGFLTVTSQKSNGLF